MCIYIASITDRLRRRSPLRSFEDAEQGLIMVKPGLFQESRAPLRSRSDQTVSFQTVVE